MQAAAYQALGIEGDWEKEPLDEREKEMSIELANVAITELRAIIGETRSKKFNQVQIGQQLAKKKLGSSAVHKVIPKLEEQSLYFIATTALVRVRPPKPRRTK